MLAVGYKSIHYSIIEMGSVYCQCVAVIYLWCVVYIFAVELLKRSLTSTRCIHIVDSHKKNARTRYFSWMLYYENVFQFYEQRG